MAASLFARFLLVFFVLVLVLISSVLVRSVPVQYLMTCHRSCKFIFYIVPSICFSHCICHFAGWRTERNCGLAQMMSMKLANLYGPTAHHRSGQIGIQVQADYQLFSLLLQKMLTTAYLLLQRHFE